MAKDTGTDGPTIASFDPPSDFAADLDRLLLSYIHDMSALERRNDHAPSTAFDELAPTRLLPPLQRRR